MNHRASGFCKFLWFKLLQVAAGSKCQQVLTASRFQLPAGSICQQVLTASRFHLPAGSICQKVQSAAGCSSFLKLYESPGERILQIPLVQTAAGGSRFKVLQVAVKAQGETARIVWLGVVVSICHRAIPRISRRGITAYIIRRLV